MPILSFWVRRLDPNVQLNHRVRTVGVWSDDSRLSSTRLPFFFFGFCASPLMKLLFFYIESNDNILNLHLIHRCYNLNLKFCVSNYSKPLHNEYFAKFLKFNNCLLRAKFCFFIFWWVNPQFLFLGSFWMGYS